ncbi:MAG: MBL fold metallo-hydrolase [Burkholderiales bacterium]|jgi:metallo-beta-lactamase family protein|nr:MBL fold metallo-hydrolase [Burkholderiales bacterium]
MKITFLGAADTVTGSKHLVDAGGARVLLDCGLFQGFKLLRERNWAAPAVLPGSIDAVVLSHAHLDHSGWLPALVKHGFKGPVYASAATRDLAEVLLLDSAHLQEEDARRANRGGWSRHKPALPLYDVSEAKSAIAKMIAVPAGRSVRIGDASIGFTPVGHLLGANALRLGAGGRTLVFSGDLGRADDLLMPAPRRITHADLLLIESTYGNRLHPIEDVQARLGAIVRTTTHRGGSVLLPSFAVGRAQALLLVLQRLKAAGEIPTEVRIFLDSPMATAATALYQRYHKLLRITAREAAALTEGVSLVATPEESQRLTRLRWPKVVISAAGMATGGRVLYHLKAMAPNPRNAIVFPGFQVGGTRGANLIAGAKEVKIHGEFIAVKAEVSHLEGFSGHADANELMDWLRAIDAPPEKTFVVHGEPAAADALRLRIKSELGWPVAVPEHGSSVEV